MFGLNGYTILGGFVFSTIGLGALRYGRQLELWQPIAIGLALMIYPYFFGNPYVVWGIGSALLALLWRFHHE